MERQNYRLNFSENLKTMGKKILEALTAKQKAAKVLNHQRGRGRFTVYTAHKGVRMDLVKFRDFSPLAEWSRQRRRRLRMDTDKQLASVARRQARLERQQARKSAAPNRVAA